MVPVLQQCMHQDCKVHLPLMVLCRPLGACTKQNTVGTSDLQGPNIRSVRLALADRTSSMQPELLTERRCPGITHRLQRALAALPLLQRFHVEKCAMAFRIDCASLTYLELSMMDPPLEDQPLDLQVRPQSKTTIVRPRHALAS